MPELRALARSMSLAVAVLLLPTLASAQREPPIPAECLNIVQANVVALDQVYFWNRFGAVEPQGMMYALEHDVVSTSSSTTQLTPGKVALRPGKRPRPLVLRMNVGDCLFIKFTNLLAPTPVDQQQPATRAASIHVVGMQVVNNIHDDGSYVGANVNTGVILPGQSTNYRVYAEREGGYLMHSMGAIAGGEGDAGSISAGLFGAINVEPRGSEWYRSQVTREDLNLAAGISIGNLPTVNYNAVYPNTHPFAGRPILKMTDSNGVIVHSDLTAIITGPNAGNFTAGTQPPSTPTYPNREQPFREFTIIFHDEIGAVQAFPHFEDEILQFPLHSARDAFAINYGTGGIGAEILANRLGVGPVHDCDECKYEEFFLSSWAVGDPAMVVDVPASKPCTVQQLREGINCQPTPGRKATKAFYPDDPSNVYHSYLNDHVKFRNLHAGSDDHHVFHLHAHQWVHTPRSDLSAYLDSQTIGQGASFTYEIAYRGSGNRNRTIGDAIFHCHFYPHFAQGMWGLWRVHDVLERGTVLDSEGRPATGARALPDGEIVRGTPIPGVVPIPVLPMAPLPGQIALNNNGQVDPLSWDGKHPGYPFFIPGRAGRRPPHPPLDTIHDGGLPRHVVINGSATSVETRHDFSKVVDEMDVVWLDETGETIEKTAMDFHADSDGHPTRTPLGIQSIFKVNGAPPVRGAPYADPCINDNGTPVTDLRTYKAADIQLDVKLNKKGWHYPQQRILSLWNDVDDYLAPLSGSRPKPPEPLFIRAESGECVEYWLTNLTPSEYHLDDFQVRTPTDILGQHIHLVKFDVTSSDGAGNGFNYEDGSFAPEEVQERIHAIREFHNCSSTATGPDCPVAEAHPFFSGSHDADCDGENDWLGAQTTVQRWWADPITTLNGAERTIRTVFTHDHFGPSTHQQAGLYAGLVIEPKGSNWYHNENGTQLSTDNAPGLGHDGGPTSWQARVEGTTEEETYREFMVAYADFQLAYEPGSPLCPNYAFGGDGLADPDLAVNPPGREELPPPDLYEKPDICPTNENDPDGPILPNPEGLLPPCPELVSAEDPGMVAVNYRNEPVALRVLDPSTGQQTAGRPGDLSFAYSSVETRADTDLNSQPTFYQPLTRDLEPGDPFTPLFRVYEGDRVHIRTLIGAHEEPHNFTVHGVKWLAEPDYPNSGYRNSQGTGISEWFDFVVPRVPSLNDGDIADFLYKPSAASEWQWSGMWGLLRVYRAFTPAAAPLPKLSTNDQGKAPSAVDDNLKVLDKNEAVAAKVPGADKAPSTTFRIVCPNNIPVEKYRVYNVTAVLAQEALQDDPGPVDGLVYNGRQDAVKMYQQPPEPPEPSQRFGPLHDPTAILFVRSEDLDWVGSPARPRLKQAVRREPLILRANAGECVRVNLLNALPASYADLDGWNAMPMILEDFNANDVNPSLHVGLHPQLVYYDIRNSDGSNAGINPKYAVQTVGPNERLAYFWYTGDYEPGSAPRAIEFGSTGLTSADPVKHSNKAAVGALIVEPTDTTWTDTNDADGKLTRASSVVTYSSGKSFLEYVLVFQDDVNQRYGDGAPVENLAGFGDPEASGQKAVNYRTEPLWFRAGWAPDTPLEDTRTFTLFHELLSNNWIGGADPETPVFVAGAGKSVRFRAIHPAGHTQSHVFDLHGHIWEELPYTSNSTVIGSNPDSEWQGARGGHGPSNHFEVIPKTGAGGKFSIAEDYLYRDYAAWLLDGGIWGLFRVVP